MVRALASGEPIVRDVEFLRRLYQARAEGRPDPAPPDHIKTQQPTEAEQAAARALLKAWESVG